MIFLFCSIVLSTVSIAIVQAQSSSSFAAGEGQRVYDMLDGLGCIGNMNCTFLNDFLPTNNCDLNPDFLRCNSDGHLIHL
jgi:hypothetical protein